MYANPTKRKYDYTYSMQKNVINVSYIFAKLLKKGYICNYKLHWESDPG